MDDLINRQAAMTFPLSWEHRDKEHGSDEFIAGVECYRDYIEGLPSAQSEFNTALYADGFTDGYKQGKKDTQRWIPVSERLPFVGGEYLVTLTDKEGEWVSTAQWNTTFGGRWQDIFPYDGYRDIGNVIAWMPLPKPYKGEEE